jgi:hypothetical protein
MVRLPNHRDAKLSDLEEIIAGDRKKEWSREWELNPRPADYESAALPLSYLGSAGSADERRTRIKSSVTT